jgi:hypothetical protein
MGKYQVERHAVFLDRDGVLNRPWCATAVRIRLVADPCLQPHSPINLPSK